MASFDTHIKCDKCHDKGPRNDPCLLGRGDCLACLLLTPDQHQPISVYVHFLLVRSVFYSEIPLPFPNSSLTVVVVVTLVIEQDESTCDICTEI